jgi:ribokinase
MNFGQGVVVVGSLNMDFVVRVAELPRGGETVAGREFQTLPGGKGANQAYAVARLGGRAEAARRVWMVGCVGRDVHGEQLVASLRSAGVETGRVRATAEAATGVALIVVAEGGQNQIVVAAGANECLRPDEVTRALADVRASHLLLQLETPIETVAAAARQAKARGMTVILDPAPARALDTSLLEPVDILTPNESEALALLGAGGDEILLADAPAVARRLLALGPRLVILKLGDKGAYVCGGGLERHFPARRVMAVDATAAGDCFNGALAVALSEGVTVAEAVEFAVVAASITVTRLGAQASIPARAEVDQWRRDPAAGRLPSEATNEG